MRAAIGIPSTLALCPGRNGVAAAQAFWPHLVRSAFGAMGAMLISLAATSAQAQCTPQELAKLIASDGAANDNFGFSVAVSGDTAVIGAYQDDHAGGTFDGSAYIFVRSGPPGSEVWIEQAKLTATDAQPDDQFGNSVAISGDTVIIGAHFDDHPDPPGIMSGAGSAYVFVRSGTAWTQQAKLIASDADSLDDFGWSVSLEGDTAVIGAYGWEPTLGSSFGAAYVFVRTGAVWTQQAILTASDAFSSDNFGRGVSLSGDTAVIGANGDDFPGLSNAGSAYVFVRTGTTWTQQQKLTASDAATGDSFGWSAAVSGDTAVVGAYLDDLPGDADRGSAYVFVRTGTVWTQQAKLTASDGTDDDEFGRSVAVSGSTALAGAHLADGDLFNAGVGYVFVKPPGGWTDTTDTAKLIASDAADQDLLGFAVALSDDTAVVGGWGDDHPGVADAGSAYIFDLAGCGSSCVGDLDGGGAVSGIDLALLLGAWTGAAVYAPCPPHQPADFNDDCKVNGLDLALLLGAWGPCP